MHPDLTVLHRLCRMRKERKQAPSLRSGEFCARPDTGTGVGIDCRDSHELQAF